MEQLFARWLSPLMARCVSLCIRQPESVHEMAACRDAEHTAAGSQHADASKAFHEHSDAEIKLNGERKRLPPYPRTTFRKKRNGQHLQL